MWTEAQAMVADRRGPEIAALRTEPGRPGVFAWAGGGPVAGTTALLAYNKNAGALRCCGNTPAVASFRGRAPQLSLERLPVKTTRT